MTRDKSRKNNPTPYASLVQAFLSSSLSFVLGVSFVMPPHAQADQQIAPQSLEVQARRVDRVALQSQDAASTKLKLLIKKYAGKAQEGVLLMRLAQIYQEGAAIEFRIGHGKGPQNIQLVKYKARLGDAVTTINDLLKRFPNYPLVDEALFIRAKAFEELGQKDSAKSDYLNLTRQFTDSKHLLASYMALADLVIEKNNHAEAIQYLGHIEKHPESSLFPFALYKMAWSNYNLKNIPAALSYIERHVRLYAKKLQQNSESGSSKTQDISASDLALRENSLMDTATFYFDGYEMGIPSYTLSSALNYFESLHPGEQFGKMTLRFAKLLRSRQREADLITWKNEILRKQPSQIETMDVVMTLFDHLWDQRRLDEIPGVCSNIESLFKLNEKISETVKSDNYLSARNALTTRAEALQEAILKSGQASNTQAIQKQMTVLRSLYTTFIHIVPETDPRILLAHYNLAETLFKTADFQQATENYRWILAHWNKLLQFSHSEIEIKAIASRYEWLHQNHKLPVQITPKLPDQTTWAQLQPKLSQEVREWAEWIDSYSGSRDSSKTKSDPEAFNNFVFELNRTLYEQGGKLASRPAIERLVRFADRNPTSKFAIPSQELVLDSLMLTQNWPEIGRVANYFIKKAPRGSAFRARLEQLSADTSFKQLEVHYQAKNYDQAQDSARSYIRSFPKNPRVADALFLIANTSLAKKNEKEAFAVYSEIVQKHPDSSFMPKALTGRAQLSLNSAQWANAAEDFEKILQLKILPSTAPEYSTTWKKLAFLKWITGQKPLSCSTEHLVQSSELKAECEKYSVLYSLANLGESSAQSEKLAHGSANLPGQPSKQHALKSSDENRALWALLALAEGARLSLHERLVMIRTLSTQWEKLDSTLKLTTLSQMNQILPQTLESIRLEIKKATPMNRVTAKAVQIRAEWIREFEESIAKMMKLPWYRLQALGLSELALAYDDFVVSLQNAPVPKDISQEEALGYQKTVYEIIQPFSQKRDEIAERSVRVASESAVESEIRKTVLNRFPSVTKKVEKDFEDRFQKKFGNASGETVPPGGLNLEASLSAYETLLIARKPHPETSVDYIQLWLNAYREAHKKGSWTQCAYLLQEIAERKVASEVQNKIMHAMTLAAMGAQAEALVELQSLVTQKSFQQELASNQVAIAKLLLSQYIQAGALDNSILMTQSIEKLTTATLAQNEKGAL